MPGETSASEVSAIGASRDEGGQAEPPLAQRTEDAEAVPPQVVHAPASGLAAPGFGQAPSPARPQGAPDAARSTPYPTPIDAPPAGTTPTAPALGLFRLIALGALVGALWYVALFGLDIWLHQSAEYMGVAAEDVTSRLTELFAAEIRAQQLGILAMVIPLGASLGIVAGLFVHSVAAHHRRLLSRRARLVCVALVVLWLHQWLLVTSIAHYPAVYAPGGAQSTWMAISIALAVDIVPLPLAQAFLWAPLCLVGGYWANIGLRRLWARVGRLQPQRQTPVAALSGITLGLLVGLFALIFSGPSSGLKAFPGRAPNVLIIGVDSLRADALDLAAPRDIAPNIRAFAANATHFTRAIPTVPRTYPSWASMLTGMYPHAHKIRHMFPAPPAGKHIEVKHSLPAILGARGYRTGVFSDFAGDVFTRADFGFQTVVAPEFTLPSNVALGGLKLHLHFMPWFIDMSGGRLYPEILAFERLAEPAFVRDNFYRWLADGQGQPFMAVVFLSAGHFPFAAPEPHSSRFVTGDYDGPSRFLKSHFNADLNDAAALGEATHLRALHEGAIHASDAAIGDMLRDLSEAGLLENTIVIVTADHGEGLYEHGLGTGHGDHLYGRATMEVPLIIDYPDNPRRGERFDTPVSLADLAPTVLGRLSVLSTAPPDLIGGLDLIATPSAALQARPVFSEIDLWFFPPETHRLDGKRIVTTEGFDGFDYDPDTGQIFLGAVWEDAAIAAKHRVVYAEGRKLIYIPTREGVRLELYDPLADPGDLNNLATSEPEGFQRLTDTLYRWMLLDPAVEAVHGWVLPREPVADRAPPR